KTMTFPRGKDRLRYLVRALPAEHEARVLRCARAAGLPCPEVLDVRTLRRRLLPSRSWLVLRALPVVAAVEHPMTRLADQAALALRMLTAGIEHRDLHGDNFVRLDDGTLAVLDMQSARAHRRSIAGREHRLAAATRLIRDLDADAVADGLMASGLVRDAGELAAAVAAAARQREDYRRGRVLRCMQETTEFTRTIRWAGIEHRHRGPLPPGRWLWRRGLRRCWIGQRARALFGSRSPVFPAFFQKWWWLGGTAGLYVPDACREDTIDAELASAASGMELLARRPMPRETHEDA
ncbi:MAG: hypothetical protein KDC98_08650, partial [Planctomycetes bacterium]|nr:hypothetical protein [Planctomycetota bacterium]